MNSLLGLGKLSECPTQDTSTPPGRGKEEIQLQQRWKAVIKKAAPSGGGRGTPVTKGC